MATKRTSRAIKADDTRKRLFVAAAELMSVSGYHATTVDGIVKRAGVAKGTFFLHFATKDAVVHELVRRQVIITGRVRDEALAAGGSAIDALRAVIFALGEQAGVSRGLSRAMLAATLENPAIGSDALFGEIHASLVSDVEAAQGGGLLGKSADAYTIASALMGAYLGAAVLFMSSPRTRPLATILEPAVDAVLAGFGAAPRGPRRTDAPAASPAPRAGRVRARAGAAGPRVRNPGGSRGR